jgi:hypothetical protein
MALVIGATVCLLACPLTINRVFSMRDELSYVTKRVWGLVDAFLHIEKAAVCGAFITFLFTFVYLCMSTGFGYSVCPDDEGEGDNGQRFRYIRWLMYMWAGPVLLMIACDFSGIGAQVEMEPQIGGFLERLLTKILGPKITAELDITLGLLKVSE